MTAADEWDEKTGPNGPDFEPIVPLRKQKKRSGLRYVVAAVILLVGGGAGAWYLWGDSLFVDPDAEIPLVRAESGPVKVRPESPGGMDVPDRDKLVYDRIDGNGERPTVERLLPTPETPQALPVPPAEPKPAEQPAAAAPVAPTPLVPERAPDAGPAAPPPPVPPAAEPAPSVAEVLSTMRPPPPPEGGKTETAAKPAETPAPPPPKPEPLPAPKPAEMAPASVASSPADGGFKVQLAAVRSREAVESEWKRLQGKNSDLLGALDLSVQRADLGPGKGVFFRLRAGPVATEPAARELCDKLKARKIGCLVVRPEG